MKEQVFNFHVLLIKDGGNPGFFDFFKELWGPFIAGTKQGKMLRVP